jgi:hypothetical protein
LSRAQVHRATRHLHNGFIFQATQFCVSIFALCRLFFLSVFLQQQCQPASDKRERTSEIDGLLCHAENETHYLKHRKFLNPSKLKIFMRLTIALFEESLRCKFTVQYFALVKNGYNKNIPGKNLT